MLIFAVRLPPDLHSELTTAAGYLHAKDPSELVRGWIRDEVGKLDKDPRYRAYAHKRELERPPIEQEQLA